MLSGHRKSLTLYAVVSFINKENAVKLNYVIWVVHLIRLRPSPDVSANQYSALVKFKDETETGRGALEVVVCGNPLLRRLRFCRLAASQLELGAHTVSLAITSRRKSTSGPETMKPLRRSWAMRASVCDSAALSKELWSGVLLVGAVMLPARPARILGRVGSAVRAVDSVRKFSMSITVPGGEFSAALAICQHLAVAAGASVHRAA